MRCTFWRIAVAAVLGLNLCYSMPAFAQQPTPVSPVSTAAPEGPQRLPMVIPASAARVNTLEARIAELETRLDEQAKKDAKKDEKKEEKKEDDGYVVGSDLAMSAKWNNGFELATKNKDFKVHVGGRTQLDTSAFTGSGNVENLPANGGVGPLHSATNMRRGRLRVDGTMYEVIDWACEYDFVNEIAVPTVANTQNNTAAVPAVTDMWVTLTQIPVAGNCRVGVLKDPFGFEHLTSSRWLNFMERSYNQDAFEGAFNNGFIPGMMFYNQMADENMTWWIGEFKNVNNIFANGVGDGELSTVGRITWTPWYQDEGRYLLHLGVAGRHEDLDQGVVRFRSRGDVRSGAPGPQNPVFADTGFVAGDKENQLGIELASVLGPWTIQSEYFANFVTHASTPLGGAFQNPATVGRQVAPGSAVGTYFAQGAYVEVLYFLTGEHRAYNRKTAVFDRVVPNSNFFVVRDRNGGCCTGWGAWQVGARYNYLDLNDSGINGGVLNAFTFGVNWFWNPNMKVQFNYDYMDRSFNNNALVSANGSGGVDSYGARFAFDF